MDEYNIETDHIYTYIYLKNNYFITAENVRCEWVNHYQEKCYCDINLVDPTDNTRITKRTITLNGTLCGARNECEEDNGGCAHLCEDNDLLPDGFRCKCFQPPDSYTSDVWTLSENKYDCLDVDECADRAFVDLNCASPGKCINTPGWYKCIHTAAIAKSGQIEAEGKLIIEILSVCIK